MQAKRAQRLRVVAPARPKIKDPVAAMVPRFNFLLRLFTRRFEALDIADADTARLHARESAGAVVYVMRYASGLDYLLFNALFVREGLALAACANGVVSWYFAPVWRWLRGAFAWIARFGVSYSEPTREHMARAVEHGGSVFLFLRSARGFPRTRRTAIARGERELELLEAMFRAAERSGRNLSFVPLALFWRRGPRTAPRFRRLTHSPATRPSEFVKLFTFALSAHDLGVKVGTPQSAQKFLTLPSRGTAGAHIRARRMRRRLLRALFGEERTAFGPVLKPLPRVARAVLRDPRVMAAVHSAAASGTTLDAAQERARKIFHEIAANMAPRFLGFASAVAGWGVRRLYGQPHMDGLETFRGLTKQYPVVMVPSHRSYGDFVLLSWLLHRDYITPPHIAARDNMNFVLLGWLFRLCGAFYLRQRFDDALYKTVFRAYVRWLVSEGFLQEFFIEGGRSRTGKTLVPKPGMLSWIVQGFVSSGRRDLFFAPIAISYEQLVEESSLASELAGGAKTQESLLGFVCNGFQSLWQRRPVLRRGEVFVNFGEPISLARELGEERALFQEAAPGAAEAATPAQHAVIEKLANKIVERINDAMVANASAVAACALLAGRERGLARPLLTWRMHEVVELLRIQDVRLTPALEASLASGAEFRDVFDSLLHAGLLARHEDHASDVLYVAPEKWRALDVYRNAVLHRLAAPSLLVRGLLCGATRGALREDLAFWMDFFYEEFFVAKGRVMAAHFDAFLDHFEARGALQHAGEWLVLSEKGRARIAFLAGQTRALFELHHAVFAVLATLDAPVTPEEFTRRAHAEFESARLRGAYWFKHAFHEGGVRTIAQRALRRGWLAEVRGPAGAKEGAKLFAPGPQHAAVSEYCERLAAALACG